MWDYFWKARVGFALAKLFVGRRGVRSLRNLNIFEALFKYIWPPGTSWLNGLCVLPTCLDKVLCTFVVMSHTICTIPVLRV